VTDFGARLRAGNRTALPLDTPMTEEEFQSWWRNATPYERRCATLRADPDSQPHGVPNTYRNHGCRCDPCSAAMSAESSELGRRGRKHRPAAEEFAEEGEVVEGFLVGTPTAGKARGCREHGSVDYSCPACRAIRTHDLKVDGYPITDDDGVI